MEITFKGTLAEVMQQVWEFAWSVGVSEPTRKSELDPEAREALAETAGQKKSHKDLMADFERGLIMRALDSSGDNITKAAGALGLSRAGLYHKMERYDLGR